MLNFYIIQDDKTIPNYLEQEYLEFAGSLDFMSFENLRKKGIIENCYDYYSFRWEKIIIEQKIKRIKQDRLDSDIDIQILLKILDKARVNDCGLYAYSE
jgi:hypothetical protein